MPEKMVGAVRFELTTSWSRTKRATKLRYAPTRPIIKHLDRFCRKLEAELGTHICQATIQDNAQAKGHPVFHNVRENLYRFESSGQYYALIKKAGKQFPEQIWLAS